MFEGFSSILFPVPLSVWCAFVCSSNPSLCMCSHIFLLLLKNNYWSILFWQPLYHAGQLHKRPQASNNIVCCICKYIDICTKNEERRKKNRYKKRTKKIMKTMKKETTPNPSWKCMNWNWTIWIWIYCDGFPSKSLDANIDACCCGGTALLFDREHREKCHRISRNNAKIHHILFVAASICQWRSI